MNRLRWLVFAPVAFLAIFTSNVKAEPIQGLQAVGYSVDAIPPTRSDTAYPICGSELENNINRSFDGEPFQQCPSDYFMVHYTGAITIPAHDTIEFMIAADDGGTITIGQTEFGTWDDKGCSWSEITTDAFPTGSQSLDGWFYENGGGTCFMLAWNIDNAGWEIVPDQAFTTEVTTTTTTTLQETTTSQVQTTTTSTSVVEQTSTTEPIPPTTTTEPPLEPTTTVEETTTTSSSSTSVLPSTTQSPTTTAAVVQTTLAQTTTTATTAPVTTTSSLPPVMPVEPTEVPTATELTTMTANELEAVVDTLLANADTTEELTAVITELLDKDLTDEQFATVLDTVFAEPLSDEDFGAAIDAVLSEPLNEEQFTALVDVLESDNTTTEQVVEAVTQIIENGVSEEQAVELATSEKVLESVTADQADEIFDAVDVGQITEAEGLEIVNAVQDAPKKVRASFEQEINTFDGKTDTYIPLGSVISIGVRRVIVVSTAFMIAVPPIPVPVRRR